MIVLKRKRSKNGHYSRVKDHFYQSSGWRKFRKYYLKRHPFCVDCEKEGKWDVLAVVLDHIWQRSKGGPDFPGDDGLRGLCVHHDAIRQRLQSMEGRAI